MTFRCSGGTTKLAWTSSTSSQAKTPKTLPTLSPSLPRCGQQTSQLISPFCVSSSVCKSMLMAQVCTCYPQQTAGFAQEIMGLLDKHYAILTSSLRQSLVKSLILLRNRGHLKSAEVLPLFFRLFRCQDKNLRDLLFKHIVAGMHESLLNSFTKLLHCNLLEQGVFRNRALVSSTAACSCNNCKTEAASNCLKL